jgi:hypothetical protein
MALLIVVDGSVHADVTALLGEVDSGQARTGTGEQVRSSDKRMQVARNPLSESGQSDCFAKPASKSATQAAESGLELAMHGAH